VCYSEKKKAEAQAAAQSSCPPISNPRQTRASVQTDAEAIERKRAKWTEYKQKERARWHGNKWIQHRKKCLEYYHRQKEGTGMSWFYWLTFISKKINNTLLDWMFNYIHVWLSMGLIKMIDVVSEQIEWIVLSFSQFSVDMYYAVYFILKLTFFAIQEQESTLLFFLQWIVAPAFWNLCRIFFLCCNSCYWCVYLFLIKMSCVASGSWCIHKYTTKPKTCFLSFISTCLFCIFGLTISRIHKQDNYCQTELSLAYATRSTFTCNRHIHSYTVHTLTYGVQFILSQRQNTHCV